MDDPAPTNAAGSVSSSSATIAVSVTLAAPAITSQPATLTVNSGTRATFVVGASGTSVAYQWYRNGTAIAGATGARYTIPVAAANDAGHLYRHREEHGRQRDQRGRDARRQHPCRRQQHGGRGERSERLPGDPVDRPEDGRHVDCIRRPPCCSSARWTTRSSGRTSPAPAMACA
ncbi:immunoglobulin domain-containing protein [Massilia phosphatilytica]